MQEIDLEKLIGRYELDKSDVAKQLFPQNNYPLSALKRVMKGGAFLDSNQLSKLALLCGIKMHELWGMNWVVKTDNECEKSEGIITIIADTYKAQLDTKTWITKIFDDGSLIHETIIYAPGVPLSQYLDTLSNIIEERKEPLN